MTWDLNYLHIRAALCNTVRPCLCLILSFSHPSYDESLLGPPYFMIWWVSQNQLITDTYGFSWPLDQVLCFYQGLEIVFQFTYNSLLQKSWPCSKTLGACVILLLGVPGLHKCFSQDTCSQYRRVSGVMCSKWQGCQHHSFDWPEGLFLTPGPSQSCRLFSPLRKWVRTFFFNVKYSSEIKEA